MAKLEELAIARGLSSFRVTYRVNLLGEHVVGLVMPASLPGAKGPKAPGDAQRASRLPMPPNLLPLVRLPAPVPLRAPAMPA